MKQQDLINRLRDELTHIVAQTEGNSAMGLTDHNKIAENLICGLMREILGFRGLRNLNATERANYPAIDLADLGARIAVQVTATATLAKIKGTISKFLRHGLHGSFDRLVVYVLARKQDSYSQAAIDKVAGPRLSFDGTRDVLDFRDLLERAVHLEPVRLAAALRGEELSRAIKDSDIKDILKIEEQHARINAALALYYEEVKFLAQNRQVDVIVCVVPTKLYNKIAVQESAGDDERLEEVVDASGELNFRRALKARTMHLGKPLQLLRETSLKVNQKDQQADCVKAWNLCTALYYKSGPVVPWRLKQQNLRFTTCAVGIAFYRSRDYRVTNTSLAQIFDELGTGIILRGTPVDLEKDDRVPHLKEEQAYNLLVAALEEYRIALKNYPARLVVHKSSRFDDAELRGLKEAGKALKVDSMDFVTVLDSRLRLLRKGNYPPYRGTLLHLEDGRHALYSRGSVWYYSTYPGL